VAFGPRFMYKAAFNDGSRLPVGQQTAHLYMYYLYSCTGVSERTLASLWACCWCCLSVFVDFESVNQHISQQWVLLTTLIIHHSLVNVCWLPAAASFSLASQPWDKELLAFWVPCLLENPGFFLANSMTWKVLENHFGPGRSWKLKFKVLESPGKISFKVMHFFLVVQMENIETTVHPNLNS